MTQQLNNTTIGYLLIKYENGNQLIKATVCLKKLWFKLLNFLNNAYSHPIPMSQHACFPNQCIYISNAIMDILIIFHLYQILLAQALGQEASIREQILHFLFILRLLWSLVIFTFPLQSIYPYPSLFSLGLIFCYWPLCHPILNVKNINY